jgi:hypothetical protein
LGFTLWVDSELAWAAGTYEYRPFGVAIISNTDLFRLSDFRPRRHAPPFEDASFVGYFASLGEVNCYLKDRRRKPSPKTRFTNLHS